MNKYLCSLLRLYILYLYLKNSQCYYSTTHISLALQHTYNITFTAVSFLIKLSLQGTFHRKHFVPTQVYTPSYTHNIHRIYERRDFLAQNYFPLKRGFIKINSTTHSVYHFWINERITSTKKWNLKQKKTWFLFLPKKDLTTTNFRVIKPDTLNVLECEF